MASQMFKERRYILLRCGQQHALPRLKQLRKSLQVAVVGFTRERTKTLLHAQIRLVVLQELEIARRVHTFDYRRPIVLIVRAAVRAEPPSSRNQHRQPKFTLQSARSSPDSVLRGYQWSNSHDVCMHSLLGMNENRVGPKFESLEV
jgi:hypothetical protein